jgi:type I restriction enzyme, S subunit
VEIDRGFGCEECRYFIGDWRNVMKGSWKIKTLAEVCILKSGTTVEKSLEKDFGDVPYLKVADMNLPENDTEIVTSSRFLEEKSLKKNSVFPVGATIFPKRGGAIMTNKKRLTSVPICTDLNIMGVIPSNVLLPRFLYYYFLNIDMKKLGSGSSIPQINNYDIEPLLISFPLIPEQKRIVSIVDEAFESINIAIENTKKNLTNARELFESYLNNIFIKNGNEQEWVSLSDITTDITDGDHQPPPKSESGVPFITISNINKQDRKVDFSNTFKVSSEYFKKIKDNKKPRKGDLLYTVTGSYGIPVIVDYDMDFCFQRHIGLIRPDNETDSKCLYYLLLSRHLLNQADECATGTAQKTVSLTGLRRFSVPKIPKKKQKLIVAELDILSEKIHRLEAIYQEKITALTELKQSILQKAFTGELTADSANQTTKKAKEVIAA